MMEQRGSRLALYLRAVVVNALFKRSGKQHVQAEQCVQNTPIKTKPQPCT